MENKLVFKPTELTQYRWLRYVLNENRTYYWDKFEAIPDYLYTYYWNKYEVVPPSLTNQWDTYDFKYIFEPEYDENIILQNYQTRRYTNWEHIYWRTTQYLRVLRNDTVLTNEWDKYYDIDNAPYLSDVYVELNKQVKGAYLFLKPANQGWNFTNINEKHMNFPGKLRQYLAKSLKDITQMTNLVDVEGLGWGEQAQTRLKEYVMDGYIYAFCSKEYGCPRPNKYDGIYGSYQAYENGLIFGYSQRVNKNLYEQYAATTENPENFHMSYMSGAVSTGVLTLDRQSYIYGTPYLETDCQFNDSGMCDGTNDTFYTIPCEHISNIMVLTPTASLTNLGIPVNDVNGFWCNLVISHELNYREFNGTNPEAGNVGYMTGIIDSPDGDYVMYAKSATVVPYTSTLPSYGNFNSYAYNTNPNMYPKYGKYNNKWYVYKGEVTLEEYSPGELVEENITSHYISTYPENGIQDDYFYVYQYWTRIVVDWIRGRYIGAATASSYFYPQDGVYPNDMNEGTHYWYSYVKYHSDFSKGDYIEPVFSYIESMYPRNSYVIGDSWYVYQSQQQVVVGELVIDDTLLMGGVNYTQEINPSEDLQIGSSGAAQIDFTIFAPDASAATQYLGKDFVYYVKMASDTEWRQIGTFTLTKAELPDKQTAKIQGFDFIYKFDILVDEWLNEQTFPMTLGELFASLCDYVGCETYSTDFNNCLFSVNDNFEAVQITGRTILQYITEVSGGFCVAEPNGRIHIKQYSFPATGDINLGNNRYAKYTHEIYNVPVITSVVVRKDDEDEGVESDV